MIESLAWVLPRPSKSKYPGSFPLHFENKLYRELGIYPEFDKILHPFGGKAEHGIRCDLRVEVYPDVLTDAHNLPFRDNVFGCVVLDPPYNEDYSKRLYGSKIKLRLGQYMQEGLRVCRKGGYIVMYHWYATPSIRGSRLIKRIFLETRVFHKLRCVHIYQKE